MKVFYINRRLSDPVLCLCPVFHLKSVDDQPFVLNGLNLARHNESEDVNIYKDSFGEMLGEHLEKNHYWKFFGESTAFKQHFYAKSAREAASLLVDYLTLYLNATWLIRDNSVNIGRLLLCTMVEGRGRANHDLKLVSFTTVTGEFIQSEFTQEELIRSKRLFEKLLGLLKSSPDSSPAINNPTGNIASEAYAALYNSYNRVGRSFGFLHAARLETKPASKIAMLISALECLFSNSSISVAQQLKVRIPNYIGDTGDDKKEIRKIVNDAYDVRSRYLHGSKLPTKYATRSKIIPLAVQVDKILRTVFTKIIETDSRSFNDPDAYRALIKRLQPSDTGYKRRMRFVLLKLAEMLKNWQAEKFPDPNKKPDKDY